MATALKCPEKTVRRLLKELNYSDAAKASPKKLVKYLQEVREGLNGDSVEDMDVSNPCKSLMEEVVEAIDEEKDLKIVAADTDDEEEESEEEEAPKAKKGAKKPKTKVKAKTPVKGKKGKKSSSGSAYDPEKAAIYQKKRRKEDDRIAAEIAKGPKTVSAIAEKLGLTESRVACHIKVWNNRRAEDNPVYKFDKKKKVSLND